MLSLVHLRYSASMLLSTGRGGTPGSLADFVSGTPLSKQIAEAAQRRAGNATFRGSPTNSSANSPAVSPGMKAALVTDEACVNT